MADPTVPGLIMGQGQLAAKANLLPLEIASDAISGLNKTVQELNRHQERVDDTMLKLAHLQARFPNIRVDMDQAGKPTVSFKSQEEMAFEKFNEMQARMRAAQDVLGVSAGIGVPPQGPTGVPTGSAHYDPVTDQIYSPEDQQDISRKRAMGEMGFDEAKREQYRRNKEDESAAELEKFLGMKLDPESASYARKLIVQARMGSGKPKISDEDRRRNAQYRNAFGVLMRGGGKAVVGQKEIDLEWDESNVGFIRDSLAMMNIANEQETGEEVLSPPLIDAIADAMVNAEGPGRFKAQLRELEAKEANVGVGIARALNRLMGREEFSESDITYIQRGAKGIEQDKRAGQEAGKRASGRLGLYVSPSIGGSAGRYNDDLIQPGEGMSRERRLEIQKELNQSRDVIAEDPEYQASLREMLRGLPKE